MRPRTNSCHSLSRFSVPLLPKPQDALSRGRLNRRDLSGGVRFVSGASCVTDQHSTTVSPIESIMQYLFATSISLQISYRQFCCITARLRNATQGR